MTFRPPCHPSSPWHEEGRTGVHADGVYVPHHSRTPHQTEQLSTHVTNTDKEVYSRYRTIPATDSVPQPSSFIACGSRRARLCPCRACQSLCRCPGSSTHRRHAHHDSCHAHSHDRRCDRCHRHGCHNPRHADATPGCDSWSCIDRLPHCHHCRCCVDHRACRTASLCHADRRSCPGQPRLSLCCRAVCCLCRLSVCRHLPRCLSSAAGP